MSSTDCLNAQTRDFRDRLNCSFQMSEQPVDVVIAPRLISDAARRSVDIPYRFDGIRLHVIFCIT